MVMMLHKRRPTWLYVIFLLELEATKSRLVDSERENRDLASLAQQHLEEMEHLRR